MNPLGPLSVSATEYNFMVLPLGTGGRGCRICAVRKGLHHNSTRVSFFGTMTRARLTKVGLTKIVFKVVWFTHLMLPCFLGSRHCCSSAFCSSSSFFFASFSSCVSSFFSFFCVSFCSSCYFFFFQLGPVSWDKIALQGRASVSLSVIVMPAEGWEQCV